MDVLIAALALLSGTIGAGFASGREIMRFFAAHGSAAPAAALSAVGAMGALFLLLCRRMEQSGASSLPALCRARMGRAAGRMAGGLFLLLCATTGGAMLAACAELAALVLPVRGAYALGMALTLILCLPASLLGLSGLALPGAALCVLLPALLLRLSALPAGEACFLPAMTPDLPVRAIGDGLLYAALNTAMLGGALPMLTALPPSRRRRAVLLFGTAFAALLLPGVHVCRRHRAALFHQALPFVALSRRLGPGGYGLVAACMYAAAASTLMAMLCAIMRMLPMGRRAAALAAAFSCLLFALAGFGPLVESGYPVLGALCAALLLLLCAAPARHADQYDRPSAR